MTNLWKHLKLHLRGLPLVSSRLWWVATIWMHSSPPPPPPPFISLKKEIKIPSKATFTQNFRPAKNWCFYWFRSQGTTLVVKNIRGLAFQRFDLQNLGRMFSRYGRKFWPAYVVWTPWPYQFLFGKGVVHCKSWETLRIRKIFEKSSETFFGNRSTITNPDHCSSVWSLRVICRLWQIVLA